MPGFQNTHQNVQRKKTEHAQKPEQVQKAVSAGQVLDAPETLRAEDILTAQQTMGNQVVQRALDSGRQDSGVTDAQGNLHPSISETIQKARGGGSPLPGELQKELGGKLRHNFSGVRLHTDETADRISRAIHARAFTIGRDIFFKRNAFAPATKSGRETLVHELTHVVQQSGSRSAGQGKLKLGERGSAMEKQAERVSRNDQGHAHGVTAGAAGVVSRSGPIEEDEIQTQGEEEEIQTQSEEEEIQTQGEEEEIQTQGEEEEIQTQGEEEEIQTQGEEEEIQTQPDTVQRWPDDLMPSKGRVAKLARQHMDFIARAGGQSPLGAHRTGHSSSPGPVITAIDNPPVETDTHKGPSSEQRTEQTKKPLPLTPPQKEAQKKKPLPLTPPQKAAQTKKPLPLTPPQKAAQTKKPLPLTPPQKEAQKKKPLPPLPSSAQKPASTQPSKTAPAPQSKWQRFKGAMSGMGTRIKGGLKSAGSAISDKVTGIKDAVKDKFGDKPVAQMPLTKEQDEHKGKLMATIQDPASKPEDVSAAKKKLSTLFGKQSKKEAKATRAENVREAALRGDEGAFETYQKESATKWQKFKGFMSSKVGPLAKKAASAIGKKVGGFAADKVKSNATEGLKQFGLADALGLGKKEDKDGESGGGKGGGGGEGMGGAMLNQLMNLARENEQLKQRVAKLEEGKGK